MAVNWGIGAIGPGGYRWNPAAANKLTDAIGDRRDRTNAGIASGAEIALGQEDIAARNAFLANQKNEQLRGIAAQDDRVQQDMMLKQAIARRPVDYQNAMASSRNNSDKATGAGWMRKNPDGSTVWVQPMVGPNGAYLSEVPFEGDVINKNTGSTAKENVDLQGQIARKKKIAELETQIAYADELGQAELANTLRQQQRLEKQEWTGDVYGDIKMNARLANGSKGLVEEFDAALSQADTGAYAPLLDVLRKYTTVDTDQLAKNEMLSTLIYDVLADEMAKLEGVKTDNDALQQMKKLVDAGKTKEANIYIINRMKQKNKSAQIESDQVDVYLDYSGKDDLYNFRARTDIDNIEDYKLLMIYQNKESPEEDRQKARAYLMKAGIIK